jgi:hypothetical protein
MFRYQTLNDTIYFWFGLNTTAGAGGDGTSPLFDVRLGGAAASAAPVLSGTPDLLTNAAYTDGCYEIAVAATAGNGFAAGSQYGVFCTATISAVNPTGFVGGFILSPVVANTTQLAAQTVTAAAGVTFPSSVASPTNITAGTITTTTNLTNLPAITTNWLTGTGVDASAVTKIQAGLATPTNITAGTLTTVTNLTNLPSIPANWLTGTGTDATAVTKIQTGLATPTNITAGTITTVTNLTNAATAGDFTAVMKASITTAVPTVVDIVTGVEAAIIPVNIKYVNDIEIKGVGTTVDPWNPV